MSLFVCKSLSFLMYSVCQFLLHIQFLFTMEHLFQLERDVYANYANYARHAYHEGNGDQARSVWENFDKNALFALTKF